MALSADARTLVIGAPGYDSNTDRKGYVKVYRADEDGGNRVQLGKTIYKNATGDLFGWSVDITSDGNFIVLGSPGTGMWVGDAWEDDHPGYVRVFSLDSNNEAGTNGTWKQIRQDMMGEAIGDEFGISVSISDDVRRLPLELCNHGKNEEYLDHVRIYRLDDNGASWVQIGKDIDGDAAGDGSGSSVSLLAIGSIVAIGAPGAGIDGVWTGQVKVYYQRIDNDGTSWVQLGESMYGNNAEDWFGESIDISPKGHTLAVGTCASVGPGYVEVFSLEGGDNLGMANLKQIGRNIEGRANGDLLGLSVSLSDDAQTLAVSAPWANGKNGDDEWGRVNVYQKDDFELSWTQIGKDIEGEAARDNSGWPVSLSGDGDSVAIGSPDGEDDLSGQVRVFVLECHDDEVCCVLSNVQYTRNSMVPV